MAFSDILADNVVDAIFDEKFSLIDRLESDFACGDDIHALLGEHVLRYSDAIKGHVDEESSVSEEKHIDNVDRIEFPTR